MQQKIFGTTLIAIAAVGAAAVGYARHAHSIANIPPIDPAVTADTAPRMLMPDFAGIVAKNGPAVVNISVSGHSKVAMTPIPQFDPNDPFSEFFRRFQPPQSEMPIRSMGSGFIVSPNGVIITNAHVVDGASEVSVKLTDKREFKAKVIGVDKPTDTAVLKIDAAGLPSVHLGDPGQTGVGEWVLAIGSPFGFENSVTAGIVSAKSRTLPDEGFVPFIQTDVAVNPGNSGGPLFNLSGEVIGINSQIYSRTGGYQGLSFAIPIDVAMKVEEQLLRDGKVNRGRLGVSVQPVDQSLAESFGLDKPEGALVDAVPEGGPAAKAGIQPGDIILKFNNLPIQEPLDVARRIAELKPGSEVSLTLWRNGQQKDISLRVGAASDREQAVEETVEPAKGRLGLAVRPLSPQEPKQPDLDGGLVVERSSGPAARAGIQPGDVVLAVNGHPVSESGQLREFTEKAEKRIALLVQRGNARLFIPVELG
ncbi:MAG: DegQ family serine endoprotease [Methylococcaceae bacterium]|nr:DegQ family serine endoprotease [Methylococcaceae bacterium]